MTNNTIKNELLSKVSECNGEKFRVDLLKKRLKNMKVEWKTTYMEPTGKKIIK